MKPRSLVGGAFAFAAVTILLAGCAAPTAAPAHSPSSSAPTPTPTPATASAPGPRVPIGCADLLGSATVQALAGANAKVQQDENAAPTNMVSVAELQYGAEDCVWDGVGSGAGSTPGAYLSLSVAPDAKAAFESRFTDLMAVTTPPHPAATESVAGDESGYWCATDLDILGADGPSLTCDAEMLVGPYWVGIQVGDVSGLTRSQLTGGLTTGLGRIASGLKRAGAPLSQWASPAGDPPAACAASTRPLSASTIGLTGRDVLCAWNSAPYGSQNYELLAGGSWALPKLTPVPPADADYGSNPYVPMTVAGATSAKASCGGGTCDAYLAIGPSLVEIVYDDPGAAKSSSLLEALANAVASS
jgi:hypothetical protein